MVDPDGIDNFGMIYNSISPKNTIFCYNSLNMTLVIRKNQGQKRLEYNILNDSKFTLVRFFPVRSNFKYDNLFQTISKIIKLFQIIIFLKLD